MAKTTAPLGAPEKNDLVEKWIAATENQLKLGSNYVSVPKPLAERADDVVRYYAPREDRTVFLVVGANVWGKGFDERSALDAASKPKRYVVFKSTDPWIYVDEMGYIYRARESSYWEVKRVEPKTKAVKRG